MPRYLVVVASEQIGLYAELLDRFRDDSNVRVVLDRRRAERRLGGIDPGGDERRVRDRRRRKDVEEELKTRSHAIVKLV
jgi:hypothetical protein